MSGSGLWFRRMTLTDKNHRFVSRLIAKRALELAEEEDLGFDDARLRVFRELVEAGEACCEPVFLDKPDER